MTEALICDASPLIILAKLDKLALVKRVFQGRVLVLQCVVEEVLSEKANPLEEARLSAFFDVVEVVDTSPPQVTLGALSPNDCASLEYAERNGVKNILVDEIALRNAAKRRGIGVTGFIGILVRSAESKYISNEEAIGAIVCAVELHGARVSPGLFREVADDLSR